MILVCRIFAMVSIMSVILLFCLLIVLSCPIVVVVYRGGLQYVLDLSCGLLVIIGRV